MGCGLTPDFNRGMKLKYKNFTYDQWQDKLEDSMRKRRSIMYSPEKAEFQKEVYFSIKFNNCLENFRKFRNSDKRALGYCRWCSH